MKNGWKTWELKPGETSLGEKYSLVFRSLSSLDVNKILGSLSLTEERIINNCRKLLRRFLLNTQTFQGGNSLDAAFQSIL